MKNILLVITSHTNIEGTDKSTGFSLFELVKPYFFFKNHNCNAEIASVRGGKCVPEKESMLMDDPEVKQFWEDENLRRLVENSKSLREFNPDQFVGVFFVGGTGTLWDFPYDKQVRDFASKVYCNGGVIAAVCHGSLALTNILDQSSQPLACGKTLTGQSNEEENQDMIQHYPVHPTQRQTSEDIFRAVGANYCKQRPSTENVVKDERIITGQNLQSTFSVAAEMLQMIEQTSGGK
jgi:putative intracellular protease/amidase